MKTKTNVKAGMAVILPIRLLVSIAVDLFS
jgi:hypothetical protein